MHEPLTSSLLAELIADLQVAFPRGASGAKPAALADVYRNGLRGLSGDSVREAVRRAIQSEQYFPKVARLREIASSYDRQRTANVRHSGAWNQCGVCGARVHMQEYFKSSGKKDDQGEWIMVFAGRREVLTHDMRAHGIREHLEEVA